jgi:hypothetical protein
MSPPRYLLALGLTLAVEVPVYAVALSLGWRMPVRRAIMAALAVNAATHPLLWWSLMPLTGHESYPMVLLFAELTVCLTEALLLAALIPGMRLRRPDPLLLALSIAANGASVLAGLICSRA